MYCVTLWCLQILLAQLTGRDVYRNSAKDFCQFSIKRQKRTPKGLLYIEKFGTLCHAANVAFACLQAADLLEDKNQHEYRDFARQQISYMLGSNGKFFRILFHFSLNLFIFNFLSIKSGPLLGMYSKNPQKLFLEFIYHHLNAFFKNNKNTLIEISRKLATLNLNFFLFQEEVM